MPSAPFLPANDLPVIRDLEEGDQALDDILPGLIEVPESPAPDTPADDAI